MARVFCQIVFFFLFFVILSEESQAKLAPALDTFGESTLDAASFSGTSSPPPSYGIDFPGGHSSRITDGANGGKDIFILGGQSNMAGRAGVEHNRWDGYTPVRSHPNNKVFRLNAKMEWVKAKEPLHIDIDVGRGRACGVGPGMAFANELCRIAENKISEVGLVPCAIGGTSITDWQKGTPDYSQLVTRTNASLQGGGTIRALLWLQGETDAAVQAKAYAYEENLVKFITDYRNDLGLPTLPLLLVKIASYDKYEHHPVNCKQEVRDAQDRAAKGLPYIHVVDAQEVVNSVTHCFQSDGVHFSRNTTVHLGIKLADEYVANFGL